jgi:hypothetical protein
MKILLAIFLVLLVSCQNQQEECRSGTISTGALQKSTATAATSDLPPDFHYTAADMERAVVGAWLDRNNDTVMIVIVSQGSTIEYNIAVENAPCGPTFARLVFLCSSKTLSFSGTLTYYESPDWGDVELDIVDWPYRMKHYKSGTPECYMLIASFTDIPELGIIQNDSLHLSR